MEGFAVPPEKPATPRLGPTEPSWLFGNYISLGLVNPLPTLSTMHAMERTDQPPRPFYFKQFKVYQDRCAMKIGTDGVLLGAWASVSGMKTALDIGTGTGLIAMMLAQRQPRAKAIDAVEIDAGAYHQATENVMGCPWADKIRLFHQPIQAYGLDAGQYYDLLISNPPFFGGGTKPPDTQRVSARHNTQLSSKDLLLAVKRLMAPQGRFCVVMPVREGGNLTSMAAKLGLYNTKTLAIKPKHDKPIERLLLEFQSTPSPTKTALLVVQYKKRNHYTPAYISLTKDFYTIM